MENMRFWFTEEQEKFRQGIRDFYRPSSRPVALYKSGGLAEGSNQAFSRKMAERVGSG
jgi:hypothetical protein